MYKAMTHGLFNVINVNKKFMEVWRAIDAINAQLGGQTETVDESAQVIEAPVAETVDTVSEIDALRKLADEEGLEYDKRWGVERMKSLIVDAQTKEG